MDPTQWLEDFTSNPVKAIIMMGGAALAWWLKDRSEKKGDNKVISSLEAALEAERKDHEDTRKDRDAQADRADAAFQRQLEMNERFVAATAQNAEVLERMKWMTERITGLSDENQQLRQQVAEMTDEIRKLRMTTKGQSNV